MGTVNSIAHRLSGNGITGRQLQPGERLTDNDVYDSSDGTWRRWNSGKHMQTVPAGKHVVWVRPDKKK
jgi:hypothetical protein